MAKQKEEKTKNHSSKPNPKEKDNSYARLSSITFELLALNLIIIMGGYYLDKEVGTRVPWVWIASIFLSVIATIYYLLKKFNS